ncbi:MAG: AraC family transcriptional regulator ligand-binding domain-containing protein [Polyangiaceae bacterium]
MSNRTWNVGAGWRLMLTDVGLVPSDVLRRASLPDDLFSRPQAVLNTEEYFRLWTSVEQQAGDPKIGLRLGSEISVEAFDPPIFAALCSRNLNEAFERLAKYKLLIAPATLHVDIGPRSTSVEIEWLDTTVDAPAALIDGELAFFVQLARIGTRARIHPTELWSPRPRSKEVYLELFGVAPRKAQAPKVVFRAEDAALPFLTANAKMWDFFEPELKRRLSDLDESANLADRVRAALLELRPGGTTSMEAVSKKLGASARTLQRRLKDEGSTFQDVLNQTREELARHYLKNSRLTAAEISFLLGFDDPNSFFRAFHKWTGSTPEQARIALTAGA